MQATLPTLKHPFAQLAERLRHTVREDLTQREIDWLMRFQRVLGTIEQTFEKQQTISATNGMRSRELIDLETTLPEQAHRLHHEVKAAIDAFTLPKQTGGQAIHWPFAIGLMSIPDLDHLREQGESLASGLGILGADLVDAAYDAAYIDLGGED